jgi:hypothetical protein
MTQSDAAYLSLTRCISAQKRRMYHGRSAIFSASTRPPIPYLGPPNASTSDPRPPSQSLSAFRRPANPASPRREACESRSASLFSPEPPATPAQTEKFLHVALCVEFAKTAGALAALARHPLLAEPILSGARLLAAPLSGIGVRMTRARGAMCPGRESCDCCAPQ